MRRIALAALLLLLVVPFATATVPTTSLTSALSLVNGTANQSGNFDNRQKTYNTEVRNNFLDVQSQLNALDARLDALETPEPPPPPPPPPAACNAASVPSPIAGQGYNQVFGDCFDVLDRTTWCDNQWWEPNAPAGSQFVSNGELHLQRHRSTGFANTTMSTEPCGQANPKSFTRGYFETRMKFDTVRGNGPAFWLLASRFQQYATGPNYSDTAVNPYCQQNGLPVAECYGAELDVFEGFGNIQYGGTRMDDWWSGALHRNTNGRYGVPDSVRGVNKGTGMELEEYHVYAARWTASQVCFYVDDVSQGCVTPFDSTNQPMYLLLYNWNTVWEDENMPNTSTPDTLDVTVDWVRVWQQ